MGAALRAAPGGHGRRSVGGSGGVAFVADRSAPKEPMEQEAIGHTAAVEAAISTASGARDPPVPVLQQVILPPGGSSIQSPSEAAGCAPETSKDGAPWTAVVVGTPPRD